MVRTVDTLEAAVQVTTTLLGRLPTWVIDLVAIMMAVAVSAMSLVLGWKFFNKKLTEALRDPEAQAEFAKALSPALELALIHIVEDHLKPIAERQQLLAERISALEGRIAMLGNEPPR